MKHTRFALAAELILSLMLLTACGQSTGKDVLLHLTFDEGSGTAVADAAGQQPEAEVEYRYTHAVYMPGRDPQWRTEGVEGGCLLFDGDSTAIRYDHDDISVQGPAFSVRVWVAPRAFEWDDPNAADNGTEALTAILGQYSKSRKQGVLLGYERFGRLCFEVGTGDDWYTLWADAGNDTGYLNKYQWNLVCAQFDGKAGKMTLTCNGVTVGEMDVPAGSEIAAPGRQDLQIGRNSMAEAIAAGTYNMFSGLMDELTLYSRTLTADETALPETVPDIAFADISLENILGDDIYKTQYHGGPYQHWMNEPHGPLYYNGLYHLFYQANPVGTYWRNICWGHLVSEDMVNWRPIKEAITPTRGSVVPDGVWSGCAATDVNGVPVLFFTAGNDSFAKDGLISNQNIGAAYPADLSDPELTDWVIADTLAIEQQPGQGRAGEFRDPHVWREGDTWYMLICSGSAETKGGSALLYQTDTLEVTDNGVKMDWQYRGPVYEMADQPITFGTSWELPILLQLQNEAGTAEKYIFLFSPAPAGIADNKIYYFLGDFDAESGKFTPDERFGGTPALLDYGSNVFTGPSAFVDPVSGDVVMFSIMQDQRSAAEEGAAGWAHCVGLARRLWLSDDGSEVQMAPIEALHTLEEEVLIDEKDLTMDEANAALAGVDEDMLYLRATLAPADSARFGLALKQGGERDRTAYTVDPAVGKVSGETSNTGDGAATNMTSGPLTLTEDGKLQMELYIDRSLAEAFFNNTKSISIRAYGDAASTGLTFFTEGSGLTVEELYVARMGSIYD